MAPIYEICHQARQVIVPSRPTKGPGEDLGQVTGLISLKSFISILLATVCIFFVSVFCWKFGTLLRRFSRGKILRGGPSANVRYAKTWHGWVPLAKHEARRQRRRERFKRFRQLMAWRSSHADYSWVWWDPGGKVLDQHFKDQKVISWIPPWLMSYGFEKADSIWNPGPPYKTGQHSEDQPIEQVERESCGLRAAEPRSRSTRPSIFWEMRGISGQKVRSHQRPAVPPLSHSLSSFDGGVKSSWLPKTITRAAGKRILHSLPNIADESEIPPMRKLEWDSLVGPRSQRLSARSLWMLNPPGSRSRDASISRNQYSMVLAASFPNRPDPEEHHGHLSHVKFSLAPGASGNSLNRSSCDSWSSLEHTSRLETAPKVGKTLSWKYKAWAARMQIETFDKTSPHLWGYAGRPGSPSPEVLKSFVSSGHGSDFSVNHPRGVLGRHTTRSSAPSIDRVAHVQDTLPRTFPNPTAAVDSARGSKSQESEQAGVGFDAVTDGGKYSVCSTNTSINLFPPCHGTAFPCGDPWFPKPNHGSQSLPVCDAMQEKPYASQQTPKNISKANPRSSPQRRLSDPEVRLIYNLVRKLEWLSAEVDPGRKPFHFLLLPNHWLNKSTWIVLDPVSRVSGTIRRMYGDPRFNYPLPDANSKPRRPKYSAPRRKRAELPRLDSWRLAVNRVRKSSGVREFLHAVELFEGSADEPPDGAIDPASWILRKPPQGFEMSSKQKSAYYEGEGGWQERLSDWQNIRRAHRARNVIFEGKANRRRLVEVARTVGRTCQRARSNFTRVRLPYKSSSLKLKRKQQRGRLTGGPIPRRPRPQERYRRIKLVSRVTPNLQRECLLANGLPVIEERDGECSAAIIQLPLVVRDASQMNMAITAPTTTTLFEQRGGGSG